MIDMAQCDRTLRNNSLKSNCYNVINNNGLIVGSFDNQSDAIRFALKDFNNRNVVKVN